MEFGLGDLLVTAGMVFLLFGLPGMVVRAVRKRSGRG